MHRMAGFVALGWSMRSLVRDVTDRAQIFDPDQTLIRRESQLALGRSPSVIFLTTAAGFPWARTPAGTVAVTTLPAATMLSGPTSTPGAMNAWAAIHDRSWIVTGFVTS